MEIVIDLDKIKDATKKEWLINSLKLMHIGFDTQEKRQTIEEYNEDLELGDAEIKRGEFLTVDQLRAKADKW
ncbi:hypothetical protein [Mucilaginibacter psychrotolerans]|uniref:Uncharacterized protein n=1 Tax=Mucilaginibacter psychrotolerans TaxID=1524096 RepID=A0A4Y8SLV9_9SPHI|nr:hypothetical protein [Mucilaginibacter psychrotolerans]TFF39675.1 hypothetical protein E2R66_04730 [Mucilaginibacter psychrotolerans]